LVGRLVGWLVGGVVVGELVGRAGVLKQKPHTTLCRWSILLAQADDRPPPAKRGQPRPREGWGLLLLPSILTGGALVPSHARTASSPNHQRAVSVNVHSQVCQVARLGSEFRQSHVRVPRNCHVSPPVMTPRRSPMIQTSTKRSCGICSEAPVPDKDAIAACLGASSART
jgi:hypothetical protein